MPLATEAVIDFHAEVGGMFGSAIAIFIIYSLWAGRRRLAQPNSWQQLKKIGKPAWWYTLHRIVNTGLLILGALVVLSGEGLDDDAMIGGHFSDLAYSLHVFAWVGIIILTLGHVLLSLKVGGTPLLLSVVSTKVRPKDWPIYWPQKFVSSSLSFLSWLQAKLMRSQLMRSTVQNVLRRF